MGLKTKDYMVADLGITVPEAYGRIVSLIVGLDGKACGVFEIQQSRERITQNRPLATEVVECVVDKDKPVFAQVYSAAKCGVFCGWEDNIVE